MILSQIYIKKASYLFYFLKYVCTGFPSAGNDLASALTMKMIMLMMMGMVEMVVVICTLSYTIPGRIITINFNKNLSMTHC